MNTPSSVAPQDQVLDQAVDSEPDADGAEELLVEEVSIDGMCGVY